MSSCELRDGTFNPLVDQMEKHGSCIMFHTVSYDMPDERDIDLFTKSIYLGLTWAEEHTAELRDKYAEAGDKTLIGASILYDPTRIDVALHLIYPEDLESIDRIKSELSDQGYTICPSDVDRIIGIRPKQ